RQASEPMLDTARFFFSSHHLSPWRHALWKRPQPVEINKGSLRQYFLDDFHRLFGKASAKNSSGFPTVPTTPTAILLAPRLFGKQTQHFLYSHAFASCGLPNPTGHKPCKQCGKRKMRHD